MAKEFKAILGYLNQSFLFEVSEIQKSYDAVLWNLRIEKVKLMNYLIILKDDLLTCLIINAPNSIERISVLMAYQITFVFDNDTKTNLEKKGGLKKQKSLIYLT